ncbi:cytochrome c oxidase subunit 3 [Siphonobacter sp. BAB-5385]|uniref:cytochrome c oxidase subunit 3 n=1 Tax=Siphonobacter sp. BAB-5385 TaxID=1864822 RepID=UPI0020CCDC0F|nr:cytochrome c oxidase subunit 3 [Siphonobacter sp. BAB-5385]
MTWLSKRREPFGFMLRLAMFGSVLIFVFVLLAYILRRHGDTNWDNVTLPRIFWLSTAVILASSATLHSAKSAFRKEHFLNYRIMLGLTLALGVSFVVLQIIGWNEMLQRGISMQGSPAGAFIYMISGLHVLHIVGGLFFLARSFWEALRNHKYLDAYVYSVNPPNQLKLNLMTLYWHFVDILWILLFAFMVYNHRR